MENAVRDHVYLVDDEPAVLAVLCRTLEKASVSVSRFDCADDCLARLAGDRCDLLISDVRMPGKDGIELLIEAKRLRPWLPVLLMTGFGDVSAAVTALKAGAADFLEKPLDRNVFLETVRSILSLHTARNSLLNHSLTRMEMKIFCHILDGRNNREIADILHRSHRTVEVHRRHLMRKMGANNIVGLLRRAAEMHLFEMHPSPCDSVDA